MFMVTLKEKYEMMKNLGKDAVIYCDMDGVLAKWEPGCTYEHTLEKDYFYNLDLQENVKDALSLLIDAGFNICLLSAAYMNGIAEVDKERWLEKHNIAHFNHLFVPCDRNKADFIDVEKGLNYFLLDDFNPNLLKWRDTTKNGGNFIAIKFLNGINGGSATWNGRTIHHHSSAEIIANTIADFATMA